MRCRKPSKRFLRRDQLRPLDLSLTKLVEVIRLSIANVIRKKEKLLPYNLQMTQKLYEEDHAFRVAMAENLLEKISSDIDFVKNVIFSDESTFYVNGVVNRHNCRIWGTEPPVDTIQISHSSPKVNVWMGLSESNVYGPFFIEGNITGQNYLDMLENVSFLKSPDVLRKRPFSNRMEHLLTILEV